MRTTMVLYIAYMAKIRNPRLCNAQDGGRRLERQIRAGAVKALLRLDLVLASPAAAERFVVAELAFAAAADFGLIGPKADEENAVVIARRLFLAHEAASPFCLPLLYARH